MEQEQERLAWHPAFREAMRAELDDYRDVFEFHEEYSLTTEPLRMDLLVIKKLKNVVIEKNIARIFLEHNIVEFKGPENSLSIEDFHKVTSYANLYASLGKIRTRSITLTFIQMGHPRSFLKFLRTEMGCVFENPSLGIYVTDSLRMPIQVVESAKLDTQENLWLKSLRKHADAKSISKIVNSEKAREMKAYLYTLLMANPEYVREEKLKMETTLKQVLIDIGWADQFKQEANKENAKNMLNERLPLDLIARCTGLPETEIKALQSS